MVAGAKAKALLTPRARTRTTAEIFMFVKVRRWYVMNEE